MLGWPLCLCVLGEDALWAVRRAIRIAMGCVHEQNATAAS